VVLEGTRMTEARPIPLRVLIVEDSPDDAELLVWELRRGGYAIEFERVDSASAMAEALARGKWDLVASDHSMLQFDSTAALKVLQAFGADIPFIIVSGTIGEERAVQALKAGASDYLVKGHLGRLIPVVQRELADVEARRARRSAELALRDREQHAVLELAAAYEATLEGWANALDMRDRATEGHSRRVTDLTVRLARKMGISDADCVHVRRGALLHDIGKMGIPDSILRKPGPLSADEWAVMQGHPEAARQLLAPIEFLASALDIPYCHHEKWDGTGYPRGLKGDEIPLAARVFAVVDVWDAIRSERPYSHAWSEEDSLAHLRSIAGSHLDPRVTAAFIELLTSRDGTTPIPDVQDTGAGARILVVDDYEPSVDLLQRWLKLDGYDVMTADSGGNALASVAAHRPDLVLLDIDIPEPNGFVVCQRLKQDPGTADIPVIFMSGHDPITAEMSARRLGAADYVPKPVDAYALRILLRRVLEQVQREGKLTT
jgi:putative two-component system response regulator